LGAGIGEAACRDGMVRYQALSELPLQVVKTDLDVRRPPPGPAPRTHESRLFPLFPFKSRMPRTRMPRSRSVSTERRNDLAR